MSNKAWEGNFFEDFVPGDTLQCPVPRTVTAGDVALYVSLTGDRTPRYCGPAGVLHPWVVFHTVFGQTVRQVSFNARANLGYADVRWHQEVKVGDTLGATLEIIGARENSNGKTGIVYVRTVGTNQRGEVVLTFYRWVMIKKRDHGTPTQYAGAPQVPELPKAVAADDLVVVNDVPAGVDVTGANWAWEDYAAGERIVHVDGMTVNPSDHMSFTRLFQNSARVHFGPAATGSQPLVYGGIPISLAYALSYNGLENRLGVAAMNGGAHANPCHAGDVLYAYTDVLETAALSDNVGALRLRMIAVKNQEVAVDDTSAPQVEDPKRGRLVYRPDVILDVDYWELMPRRAAL